MNPREVVLGKGLNALSKTTSTTIKALVSVSIKKGYGTVLNAE
jgi:hypothetical protein